MLAEWTLAWKSALEGRQTKVFWPEPDLKKSKQLIKLSRPMLGMRARIGSGFSFMQRQSAIIEQSRTPPMGDVSCRRCGEDDKTPIHIICDCGSFVSHRLENSGVHQMPETNPEWDVNSMVKFLQHGEIILIEDCYKYNKNDKGVDCTCNPATLLTLFTRAITLLYHCSYKLYINARRNFIVCDLSLVPFLHYSFNTVYFILTSITSFKLPYGRLEKNPREKKFDRIGWEIVPKGSRLTKLVIDRDEPTIQPIFEDLFLYIFQTMLYVIYVFNTLST
jgi:hypothetical protein